MAQVDFIGDGAVPPAAQASRHRSGDALRCQSLTGERKLQGLVGFGLLDAHDVPL